MLLKDYTKKDEITEDDIQARRKMALENLIKITKWETGVNGKMILKWILNGFNHTYK